MEKITTGIGDLDKLLDSIYMGDNVVWEVEAGTSVELFIRSFVLSALDSDNDVIYVSFNKSPQSILQQISPHSHPEGLTIVDCFTAGKGKSDPAFLRYYDTAHTSPRVIKLDRPADVGHFTETVNRLQDRLRPGARYVFDSLTGIQDLWGDEESPHKYFTYMCPRLFDLGTVAYWVLEAEAHTQSFKANLRHITQVVLNLYRRRERLFVKALKLDRRIGRDAFKPHEYGINENGVHVVEEREAAFNLGGHIKAARVRLGMSQKELSDIIRLTPSFVSQLESNQISPSLNSFFQICAALKINPASLMSKGSGSAPSWHIRKPAVMASPVSREAKFSIYGIVEGPGGGLKAFLARIEPGSVIDKHLVYQRGEEFIHVLAGSLSVKVDGSDRELDEGDSLHFTDSYPEQWKNTGKEAAELLLVTRG